MTINKRNKYMENTSFIKLNNTINIKVMNDDILNLVKGYLNKMSIPYGDSGENIIITSENGESFLSSPWFHQC